MPQGDTSAVTRPAVRSARELTAAALVAALLAASAWVTIPIQPVPITLQVFFVVLAALLLSPPWAGAALSVYLLLGAVGVPVFAGAQGGAGVLAGPTGGYLVGFVAGAVVGSVVRASLTRAGARSIVADSVAALTVIAIVYAVGVLQLAVVANLSVPQAFVAGAVPFLIPDLLKAAAAVVAAQAVRRALGR